MPTVFQGQETASQESGHIARLVENPTESWNAWLSANTNNWQRASIKFAEAIQLTEDYFAPGSLGSFNLQVAIKVVNHQIEDWPVGQYEMVIIPMNSCIFVNE